SKPLHFASLFESFRLISKRGRHFRDLKRAVKAESQHLPHFFHPAAERLFAVLLAWVGIIGSFYCLASSYWLK
ncbi:hypothetical protein QWY20_14830, partial [Alkalimonas sp. MEB108]